MSEYERCENCGRASFGTYLCHRCSAGELACATCYGDGRIEEVPGEQECECPDCKGTGRATSLD